MQIDSTRFGRIEVDPDTVIEFPQPLAGFENSRRYKLLHEDVSNPIVMWLQSLDEPDVSFGLIDPACIGINYEITLDDSETALLKISDPGTVSVLLMVRKEDNQLMPASHAPILINTAARLGMQKPGISARIVFSNR
ncbi:MAG: flagellar assembly protein FliW [Chitinivorax sp.]